MNYSKLNYCLSTDSYENRLKKSEFNYPYPKSFTQLNQNLLFQYIAFSEFIKYNFTKRFLKILHKKLLNDSQIQFITYQIYNQMEYKLALLYHENWRCKQYTIYDYFLNQEYRILTILKSEKQDKTQFLCNLIFKFQKAIIRLINYKSQEKQIQIKFQKLLIQPQYKYERKLIGAGLYQFIETKIVFNKQPSQNIIIFLEELGTFTYLYKDELDKLLYEAKLIIIVNIERPNDISTQHIILSKHKGEIKITYIMPYHLDIIWHLILLQNILYFKYCQSLFRILKWRSTLGMALHISNLIRRDKQ